jgi:kumamolisin
VPQLEAYGVGSIRHALPPGGETTLDLEVLDAAAPGLKRIDIFEANADAADTLQAMTAPLELKGSKPQVVSASLGLCEPDLTQSLTSGGLDDVEAALAAASATGITYLASSGDDGSADCTNQSGNPVHKLAVNYPASSWWVTGVGGTNFALNSANQIQSQLVWNDGSIQPGSAGGGGHSSRFGRPPYQKGATASKARVVPDVSMLADIIPGFAIYCSAGRPDCPGPSPWMTVGGTSAATPLLAGGMALIDQELHTAGRESLGLVNPLLYRLGESSAASTVFGDVTVGDNDVFPYAPGGAALNCCSATPGFDAASGWGSVNVAAFEQQAIAAQPAVVNVSLTAGGRQRAIPAKAIKATGSCTGPCVLGAYALVKIGSAKAFEVDSKIVTLHAKGSSKLVLKFSKAQLKQLRAAHHKKITAKVYGVLLNSTVYSVIGAPGESIQAQTGAKKVTLT